MTVRIIVEDSTSGRVVRVEGRLTVLEIGELECVLGDDPTGTALELRELRSADAIAVALLRRLRDSGASLRNVPPRFAYDLDE